MSHFFLRITLVTLTLLACACSRNSEQVWDDTMSCSRHMGRGFSSLMGDGQESRQVGSQQQFWNHEEDYASPYHAFTPLWESYEQKELSVEDLEPPSKPSAKNPNLQEAFDPTLDPILSKYFHIVHFDYNSNIVKGKHLNTIHSIASYLQKNPNTTLFIEGHCDSRGPEAYNLALGLRRSQEVKSLLVKEGIDPKRLQTLSYGKERLIAFGQDDESHKLNRRTEFKLYE